MFTKEFLSRTWREILVAFVVALGMAVLAGTGLSFAAVLAGLVAGGRAVVGIIVRNMGEFKDTPSL